MQFNLFGELPFNEGAIMRQCRSCKEDKPEESFYVTTHRKDGSPTYGYICTDCKRKQAILRTKLRMTSGEPTEKCQCCGVADAVLIDHCHETKEFRGWLCHNCNMGIGKLGDTLDGVQKALVYLKKVDTT